MNRRYLRKWYLVLAGQAVQVGRKHYVAVLTTRRRVSILAESARSAF